MAKKRVATMADITQPAVPQTATATTNTVSTQTIPEHMAEWRQNNPMPTLREVEAPTLSTSYSDKLDDIIKRYEPKEDTEQQVKRDKARKTIAAIGDGISAVANVIGTSQGGLNLYNPQNTLSGAEKARQDEKLRLKESARKQYLDLLKHAADKEQNDNQKRLSIYNSDKKAAADQYISSVRNYNQAMGNELNGYKAQRDDERNDIRMEQQKQHQAELERQGQERNDETARSHKANEANAKERNEIARERNNILKEKQSNGGNGGSKEGENNTVFTSPHGSIMFKKKLTNEELDAILSELYSAGLFRDTKGEPRKFNSYMYSKNYASRGKDINEAIKTKTGWDIVNAHTKRK